MRGPSGHYDEVLRPQFQGQCDEYCLVPHDIYLSPSLYWILSPIPAEGDRLRPCCLTDGVTCLCGLHHCDACLDNCAGSIPCCSSMMDRQPVVRHGEDQRRPDRVLGLVLSRATTPDLETSPLPSPFPDRGLSACPLSFARIPAYPSTEVPRKRVIQPLDRSGGSARSRWSGQAAGQPQVRPRSQADARAA